MGKYFVLVALLLLAFASAQDGDVSLAKAIALAQNRFPDITVSASSNPNYPTMVGSDEYWVVEFDNIWVPVSTSGEVIEDDSAIGIFKVHYAIQIISTQRVRETYPTGKQSTFNAMLADVTSTKQFISNYRSGLPAEFDGAINKLESSATSLEGALNSAGSKITSVRAKEVALISSSASWDDVEQWKTEFTSLLDSIESLISSGESYETDRGALVQQANTYAANEANDIVLRNNMQSFAGSLQIPNVPGSFPDLKTQVAEWRATWLTVVMSDARLEDDAQRIYTNYLEFGSQSDIVSLQTEAVEKVNALNPKVAAILNKLTPCLSELKASEVNDIKALNTSSVRAADAYNRGRGLYTALDYTQAREEYSNAIAYVESAEEKVLLLQGLNCPEDKPPPTQAKGIGEILIEFITSLPGIMVIVLALLLVGVYWWNKKKQEGDYYPEEYGPTY